MGFLDVLAGIILLLALISAAVVTAVMGCMPGYVARRRNHPWAQAVSIAGWVTLIFGMVFWPLALIWAYVDVPIKRDSEGQGTVS